MRAELHTLLKSRGIALPGEDEIAQLQELESRWRAMQVREAHVMPLRVADHQKAAHAAFMADPSIENEMQVAILADTHLTLIRYAARRKVISDYMKLLASKAAELLRPLCDQVSLALDAEMELRKEQKTTWYAESDPRVKECQKWVDAMLRAGSHVLLALNRDGEFSPMELVEIFLPDAPTPEDGK
jgi:hypothetical protein